MRILRKIRRKCKRIKIRLFLIPVVIILIVVFVILKFNNQDGENLCKTCKVAAANVRFESINESYEYLYFEIINQNTKPGNCFVEIDIKKDGISLKNFTQDIGVMQSKETLTKKIVIVPPEGDTEFSVTPHCDWYE